MDNIPKMPENYKGRYNKMNPYVKNLPRKWTKKECEWCLKLRDEGYTIDQIAESIDRKKVSVSIKLKRLSKRNDTYNEKHVEEKYKANERFLKLIKPKSILDVYAGQKSFYEDKAKYLRTNDIDCIAETTDHLDALKFLCQVYLDGYKYDIVDLDPYGSAYDCFDLAIKIAKKGLIITFGEMGHKRWNRFDFVKWRYGIETKEDFNVYKMIEEVQRIGRQNKKELIPCEIYNWQNISRVYFKIEKYKVTEQWERKNKKA